MPTVAIAHSEEGHRSFEPVLALVREALHHLGGMDAYVKPGQTVVIVPGEAAGRETPARRILFPSKR